jgi:uncharacterized protein YfaS (alpha-2-macroglobulin family)
LVERNDPVPLAPALARWLLSVRRNGYWATTHDTALSLASFVSYQRGQERPSSDLRAEVQVGGRRLFSAKLAGRSGTDSAQAGDIALPALRAAASQDLAALEISRTGSGRLFYTASLTYDMPAPLTGEERGLRMERIYQLHDGTEPSSRTEFRVGDVVRVTLRLHSPREGRFIAVSDSLPAGFEVIDANIKTTAADLSAYSQRREGEAYSWRRGGFDHIERHDDRVLLFATRLAPGWHEFSYLARATSAGRYTASGVRAEAMYSPEVYGRSPGVQIVIR